MADYLALPDVGNCDCGCNHDNRAVRWEDEPQRTREEVLHCLRGVASSQRELAEIELGVAEPVDLDAAFAELLGQMRRQD